MFLLQIANKCRSICNSTFIGVCRKLLSSSCLGIINLFMDYKICTVPYVYVDQDKKINKREEKRQRDSLRPTYALLLSKPKALASALLVPDRFFFSAFAGRLLSLRIVITLRVPQIDKKTSHKMCNLAQIAFLSKYLRVDPGKLELNHDRVITTIHNL